MARGARQLVVQEALLTMQRQTWSLHTPPDSVLFAANRISSLKSQNSRITKTLGVKGELPDDGHGGGVVFVLVYSHDKHGSVR